jgi:hypothetical protein
MNSPLDRPAQDGSDTVADVPAAGGVAENADADACHNCGTLRSGEYCHDCGQRMTQPRITLRGTLRTLLLDAFDLDRGLVHTVVELSRGPGHVVRRFIAGQRVRYTNPVKYFFITASVLQVVSWWLGVTLSTGESFAAGFGQAQAPSGAPAGTAITGDATVAFLDRYFVLLIAASLPLFAAGTRIAFARERLTYAEHLVLNLYLTGQLNLAVAVLLVASSPLPDTAQVMAHAGAFLLIPAYYTAATVQLFARSVLDSLARVTLASALAAAASLIVIGFFLAVVV